MLAKESIIKFFKYFSLQRVVASGRFYPEIDGLRFVAIAAVVLLHLQGNLREFSGMPVPSENVERIVYDLIDTGIWGVSLFFILSGFIVAIPIAQKTKEGSVYSFKGFYKRRLIRIVPPYVVAMTVFFLGLVFLGKLTMTDDLWNYFASILYSHNIIFSEPSVIYVAAWSLEIEVQFYLLVPLFSFVFQFSTLVRFCIYFSVYILGCGFQLFGPIGFPNTLLNWIHYFAIGFIVADVTVNSFLHRFQGGYADVAGVLSFSVFLFGQINPPFLGFRIFGPPLLLGLLTISAVRGNILRRCLSYRGAVTIGGMCYSIYLVHGRVITFGLRMIPNGLLDNGYASSYLTCVLVFVPAILLVSTLFYILIEKPSMAAAKKFGRSRAITHSS